MKPMYDMESGVPGVRVASAQDEDQIFALLCMLHQENGWFSLNPDKVRMGIRVATERRGGIIFVIEENRRITATIGIEIVSDWWSDDEYLLERWTFVHPDHRKGDYARRLLEQGKWTSDWFAAARRKPMPLFVGINSMDRLEAKTRMYARHMPCVSVGFMYGLPPRHAEKFGAEAVAVEEANKQARRDRSREVRPVVETILKLGQRDHVLRQ